MLQLTVDDAPFVAEAIADAFSDDPVQAWMSGGLEGFSSGLFGMAVPAFLEQGICYATDDRQGLALWLPPGAEPEFPEGLAALRRFLAVWLLGGTLALFETGARVGEAASEGTALLPVDYRGSRRKQR